MILADTRHQLTRDDAQLAARILARDSGDELAALEARLADEGIDAILDDPRLPGALLRHPRGAHASFTLFAYVMIRHALRSRRRRRPRDRRLRERRSSFTSDFAIGRIASSPADDEVYDAIAQLCRDLNDPDARRSFLVRTHLGNYALWLSGIFPDYIEQRRWRRGGPDLDYYEEMGRRGFQLAADHRLAEEHGLATLYATAADRFGVLRCALNAVSDTLFFPAVQSPERLMRQVRDEARWRFVT